VNLRQLAESRIVIDPDVCEGKARVRGTKVTVADILLSKAEGLTEQEILRAHRGIRAEDIKAVLAYSYCVADGVKLKLGSGAGSELNHLDNNISHTDRTQAMFTEQLEMQAALQAQLTKPKSIVEDKPRAAAPKPNEDGKKLYDFEIEITPFESTRVYGTADNPDQSLAMDYDVYVFEDRSDDKQWVVYSGSDTTEVDSKLHRRVRLSYEANGEPRQGVFDGYLSVNRLHKIFIARKPNGDLGGKAV